MLHREETEVRQPRGGLAGRERARATGRASVVWVLAFGATFAFYRRKGRFYYHRDALFTVGFLGQPVVMKHGDV